MGSVMIYIRENTPNEILIKHICPEDIEGLFVELNWKKLWSYHPPSESDEYYFENVGHELDTYNKFYDKALLVRDFNAPVTEIFSALFSQII